MKTLILFTFILACSVVNAQNKEHHKKIEALKISFLTNQLDLSPKEAQKFWPIYNAFEEKDDSLREKIHALRKIDASTSEKEAENNLNKIIALEYEKYTAEKQFLSDLQTVISSKKILILMQSERNFRYKIIKEYQERQRKQ